MRLSEANVLPPHGADCLSLNDCSILLETLLSWCEGSSRWTFEKVEIGLRSPPRRHPALKPFEETLTGEECWTRKFGVDEKKSDPEEHGAASG